MTGVVGANWAGNYRYRAHRLHQPRTFGELQDLVATTPRIRALGTRHSFNDIADTDELVSTAQLDATITIDSAARTASVSAATRYGVLAGYLNSKGYALHNMGSLPHISIAGAIATGTHGSGDRNGGLATAVKAVEVVSGGGRMLSLRRGDPDFEGAVVALGALGIVTRLELDIQPAFSLRQERYVGLPWDVVLSDFDSVTSAAYSVSLFTDWLGDDLPVIWLKWRADPGSTEVPETMWGARREVPSPRDANMTPRGGVEGPWLERLPHFRFDAIPSDGDEIQTEYFIDRTDAVAALSAIRELGEAIAPHLFITELRTVAADALWLSPAFRRDSLGIHFTWRNHPVAVAELVPQIEATLAPFAPRPHWGKWFALGADSIAPRYERFADFRDLASRVDPSGQFRNEYTRRVLGL